jgi:hypothetical protein
MSWTRLLAENREQLIRCQEISGTRSIPFSKYFVASALDINSDGPADLIVQAGEFCLQGAHNTPFWVFTRVGQRFEPGYQLVFKTQTDWLEIKKASTNSYRDIADIGHTALEIFTNIYEFDGQTYQPRLCTVQSLKTKRVSRVACSPAN